MRLGAFFSHPFFLRKINTFGERVLEQIWTENRSTIYPKSIKRGLGSPSFVDPRFLIYLLIISSDLLCFLILFVLNKLRFDLLFTVFSAHADFDMDLCLEHGSHHFLVDLYRLGAPF